MASLINMHEWSIRTTEYSIYTKEEIGIPGLNLFGHRLMMDASEPLLFHYHERVLEFTTAPKGEHIWTVETDPPVSYSFHGGDVFISYPGEPHSGRERPMRFGEIYWFQIDPTVHDNFLFLGPDAALHTMSQLNLLERHLIHADSSLTHPLFKQIFSLLAQNGDRFRIAAYILTLIHHFLSANSAEDSGITPDIEAVLSYINQNLMDELDLETLASIAQLSCSHFQQKFKKQLGIGPRHYINQQKIEYSKKLLLDGRSVTETAMLLGYNTSSYFSTVFKKYAMYTPREFLKKSACSETANQQQSSE